MTCGTPKKSPSPSRGGESERRALRGRSLIAFAFALLATPAFAASGIGGAIDPVIYELMVFVMAIFVGYYVVWSVTPALHTPLMSVTNAISSVIVVGALLAVAVEQDGLQSFLSFGNSELSKVFGLLALVMAAVNIFGGFLVTQRMLAMYKKKGDKK
jgi:NAD(P) transhydrogenase subunit alpha